MNKKDVVATLEKIATYLEIKAVNPFKIAAYRKAAQALEGDERTIAEIEKPQDLNGIGKATAEVIVELKETGRSNVLDELQASIPGELLSLLTIPGLGGKKIGKLYNELGVKDASSLLEACRQKKVRQLAGFGEKSENKLLEAFETWNTRPERLPLATVLPIAEQIEAQLEELQEVSRFSRAGSLRRMKETVKDLDFIIATDQMAEVREKLLALKGVSSVIAKGDTKISVDLTADNVSISADFRLVANDEFATALHHFTGSKDHNVLMRQLAKAQGEKISEYGVEASETGDVQTFKTEKDFFFHFGLAYIPPEARSANGEIERYETQPEDVYLDHAKADLHMHTTWSDGAHSIEEMVEAARGKGYTHTAITDHSRYLKVANGLSIEKLQKQHAHIRKLNEQYEDFTILTGVEMDILPDGQLDYPDDVLKEVDFVIASIHSAFSQSRERIMERLRAAVFNPYVHLIAHPMGRLIGRRDGYDVDVATLIKWAKETGTALELNASPKRLDLAAYWLKQAREAGVAISINSDAHRLEMLDYVQYGYAHARGAMLEPSDVINTWSLEDLRAFTKKKRRILE
ncbi:DNA polymerase/3'-5' exonuclease PolX [Shouchella shacheensis]|uniref:DNA polymerase/3'-5' exonuclease PolX n=1 Tax=Shouchella shacheensis TaxID=1649580 RepID=UPI00073FE07E|nr:DNA polymerase/3'-5' exonuclease PolX [Shouchella shacheensis]